MQFKWSVALFLLITLIFLNCNKEPQGMVEVPIEELLEGSMDIKVNPNGITPLSAKVSFRTKGATRVEWEVQGALPVGGQTEVSQEQHELPILGLYAGQDNPVIVRLTHDDLRTAIDTLRISAAPLPDYLPEIEILTARKEEMEPRHEPGRTERSGSRAVPDPPHNL